jgi:hypothetical protein
LKFSYSGSGSGCFFYSFFGSGFFYSFFGSAFPPFAGAAPEAPDPLPSLV